MLDIRMPVMNGTQALKAIRDLEHEMGLGKPDRAKVVMVTVYDDMTTVVSSFYNECDGYITKPFDKQRVMDELKRFGAA
jgi:two-component system chemotaxis response regulator CheY